MKYTKDHEWIKMNEDGSATVGISDHAQEALGDITFVELPELSKSFEANEVFSVVESVKAASDIYMPVSGEILEVNDDLSSQPELVNSDPLEGGWIVKIKPTNPSDLDSLMSEDEYLASL